MENVVTVEKAINTDSKLVTLTEDDILGVYESLSEDEKNAIEQIAKNLEIRIKEKWYSRPRLTNANFGRVQALELIAKIGIFLLHTDEINSG
jgi:hypothetical protein